LTQLNIFSEPYAKTGNMAAEGFRRLLGRPALGLLQTLIREAIQNVLDAAVDASGANLTIRLRTLSPSQAKFLRTDVLVDLPHGDSTISHVSESLAKSNIRVLEICDFGTTGLSGPTTADAPDNGSEPLNFINFLRNVGSRRDTHHGGGTYGYGKSSLYAMSECSTIVVDTQTTCNGRPARRLMGSHLGAAFDAKDGRRRLKRFTGRHWWGVVDGEDSVEPVTGRSASAMAERLGLPARSSELSGTSILILDPILDQGSEDDAAADIIESVLWYFWPRMLESTPNDRRLTLKIEVEGESHVVPKPEEYPPLDLFARAMNKYRRGDGSLIPIECGRPKRFLGLASIEKGLRTPRVGRAAAADSQIPWQAAQIALMRPAELVVKYIDGEPFSDSRFEWAGVFICSDDDDVEEAFAQAEPPAHDDWIPDNLPKGYAKTFVRTALLRLKELASSQAEGRSGIQSSDAKRPSLAETATLLGRFLNQGAATGPGRAAHRRSAPRSRGPLGATPPRFVGLELSDANVALARFRTEIRNDASMPNVTLRAIAHLVVDGGATDNEDLPAGLAPRIDSFEASGHRISGTDVFDVGDHVGTVDILVSTVPSAAVGLKLILATEEES
jgi:hypothetical protein